MKNIQKLVFEVERNYIDSALLGELKTWKDTINKKRSKTDNAFLFEEMKLKKKVFVWNLWRKEVKGNEYMIDNNKYLTSNYQIWHPLC